MAHELPPLPYGYDALEPWINTRTMQLHHDMHHAAYVKNLNAALEGHPDLAAKGIDELLADLSKVPEAIRAAVRNNGGGHANHTMFWQIMGPNAGGPPQGELGSALTSAFGDFESFKARFNDAGGKRFGSGWVWVVLDKAGRLDIVSTPNQDTPTSDGSKVIFGNDVWEHAYYLTYENRRPDYLKAWWNVVNWKAVADRFAKAK
ncbi:MAG: superoxide dismutase [Planctomycetota bacterium]